MTIEIRQLVIRAVVEPRRGPPEAPAPRPPGGSAAPFASPAPPVPALERAGLVAECTREVLRALRKERRR